MRFPGLVSRLCLLALSFLAESRGATALPQELGDGLVYLRIAQSPADLPTKEPGSDKVSTRILDLRSTSGDALGIQTLIAWLQFQAKPETPLLFLVDKHTDEELLRFVLTAKLPAQLSLSARHNDLRTDIVVDASPEAEITALELIDKGNSVVTLLPPPLTKTRMDEAVLLEEHERGVPRANENPTPAPASGAKQDSAPSDPVLTRARQLHQALRALKT